MTLLVIAGFMLFVTFFGAQFGASLGQIGKGVSELLSPQVRPALVPTIGLEWTPGIQEWWSSAQAWMAGQQAAAEERGEAAGALGGLDPFSTFYDALLAFGWRPGPTGNGNGDNDAGGSTDITEARWWEIGGGKIR